MAMRPFTERLGLSEPPGWTGVFTTEQAKGAIPNDTRVKKVVKEPGDAHPIGAQAKVLGSLRHAAGTLYFVEWDAMPKCAVAVADWKIKSMAGAAED